MHQLAHRQDNVLHVTLTGKVTGDDYEVLVPMLESEIEQHDSVRVLWDMSAMEGLDAEAAWEDAKFDLKHRADYERVAVVGAKKWHDWATQLFKPIAEGAVRYFDAAQRGEAERWVKQQEPPSTVS